MRRKILKTYTFTPGNSGVGKVTINGFNVQNPFPIERLLQIVNVTKGVVIYSPLDTATGGVLDTDYSSIILSYNTSLHSSTDKLQVIIESGSYTSGVVNSAISQISHINITNAGSGYVNGDDVTLTGGTGTNATAKVVADSLGRLMGIKVLTPGSYTVLPTGFTTPSGTGGTVTIVGGQYVRVELDEEPSADLQIYGTWVGTLQFESSIDGYNFYAQNTTANSGAISTSTTANTIQNVEMSGARFFQVRCSAYTSGTALINIGPSYNTGTVGVANAIVLASGTVTTVTSVTAANLNIPGMIADVASGALTTTTTTSTLTPTFGTSFTVSIPVTAVTGTNPTLDIVVQESQDGGTNWEDIYYFPRITTTGFYVSPNLKLTGNRVRYIQTVGGGTPSFTRAINRLQSNHNVPTYRQKIDRTLALATLNSATSMLFRGCTNAMFLINCGTMTTAPVITFEGSYDNINWFNLDPANKTYTPTASMVNAYSMGAYNPILTQYIRARVSTAGATATLNDISIIGME